MKMYNFNYKYCPSNIIIEDANKKCNMKICRCHAHMNLWRLDLVESNLCDDTFYFDDRIKLSIFKIIIRSFRGYPW